MNAKQAGYFLMNYPSLTQAAHNRRDDILNQGRQEAFTGGIKPSGHSDPTAKKGILLADGNELEVILRQAYEWINNELSPHDRPLLLAVWRLGKYGWYYTAKDQGREVWQCRYRWENMTAALAAYLNQSAGLVPGQVGNVFADTRTNP